MRHLDSLAIDGLRNLSRISIELDSRLNLFVGANGAGKSSLLEAIHLLGLGRSFRSGKLQSLIQYEQSELIVRAGTSLGEKIALSKRMDASRQLLKLNGQMQRGWRTLLEMLPLQLINAESFDLLNGPAIQRRRYLDWGVFHVEHGFIDDWRAAAMSLKQRNALLKGAPRSYQELKAWDQGFVEFAERIDEQRQRYFRELMPELSRACEELLPDLPSLSFRYNRGWADNLCLATLLSDGFGRDLRYGSTQLGPHRADLISRLNGQPASSLLSRGQTKLLVIALKLAQARLFLQQRVETRLLCLIDDLPAELDRHNSGRVMQAISALPCQVFLTATDSDQIDHLVVFSPTSRMFHVEHGKISP